MAKQAVDVSISEVHEDNTRGCVAIERGIDAACNEIRQRHRALVEVGRRSLEEAIELGGLLFAVKERLPHGQWYSFLDDAEVGTRSAQNYLRVYQHREAVRSKSALSADLTIAASLSALRSPKPKRTTSEGNAGKIHEVETGNNPQGAQLLLTDGRTSGDASMPSTFLAEQDGKHESDNGHATSSFSEDVQTSPSKARQFTDTLAGTEPVEKAVHVVPVEQEASTVSASETTGKISTSNEPDGFITVDGIRLAHNRWDDGPVSFKWVQMQITTLKRNNDDTKEENKRSVAALKVEQNFLIELSRTANQVFSTAEGTGESVIEILNGTVFRLRNYTQELARQK